MSPGKIRSFDINIIKLNLLIWSRQTDKVFFFLNFSKKIARKLFAQASAHTI